MGNHKPEHSVVWALKQTETNILAGAVERVHCMCVRAHVSGLHGPGKHFNILCSLHSGSVCSEF